MCACFFDKEGNLIMRRGDTAKFTIESDDIPFENYAHAYFAVVNPETLEPVLPELKVPTTSVRAIQFMYTPEQTEEAPQPEEAYDTYGYTFKLCTASGEEDTFIPEVTTCEHERIIVKHLPKVLFYPKVIEGDLEE